MRNNDLPYTSQESLYDGDIFGEPKRPSEPVITKRIKTLEQTILIKFSYSEYTKMFM